VAADAAERSAAAKTTLFIAIPQGCPRQLSIAKELLQFQEQQRSLSTNLKYKRFALCNVEKAWFSPTDDWMGLCAFIQMIIVERELAPGRTRIFKPWGCSG
jgi:hypothetical protein